MTGDLMFAGFLVGTIVSVGLGSLAGWIIATGKAPWENAKARDNARSLICAWFLVMAAGLIALGYCLGDSLQALKVPTPLRWVLIGLSAIVAGLGATRFLPAWFKMIHPVLIGLGLVVAAVIVWGLLYDATIIPEGTIIALRFANVVPLVVGIAILVIWIGLAIGEIKEDIFGLYSKPEDHSENAAVQEACCRSSTDADTGRTATFGGGSVTGAARCVNDGNPDR